MSKVEEAEGIQELTPQFPEIRAVNRLVTGSGKVGTYHTIGSGKVKLVSASQLQGLGCLIQGSWP